MPEIQNFLLQTEFEVLGKKIRISEEVANTLTDEDLAGEMENLIEALQSNPTKLSLLQAFQGRRSFRSLLITNRRDTEKQLTVELKKIGLSYTAIALIVNRSIQSIESFLNDSTATFQTAVLSPRKAVAALRAKQAQERADAEKAREAAAEKAAEKKEIEATAEWFAKQAEVYGYL